MALFARALRCAHSFACLLTHFRARGNVFFFHDMYMFAWKSYIFNPLFTATRGFSNRRQDACPRPVSLRFWRPPGRRRHGRRRENGRRRGVKISRRRQKRAEESRTIMITIMCLCLCGFGSRGQLLLMIFYNTFMNINCFFNPQPFGFLNTISSASWFHSDNLKRQTERLGLI